MTTLFGHQLYPTPPRLAQRLVEPYMANQRKYKLILEPSAGKGDLAGYLKRAFGRREKDIHVIEIDPELRSLLSGKGFPVVDSDFLQFDGDGGQYDLIVMNPPFDSGAKHLLHAWEILKGGEIACVLNAETVRNPHTAERQLLRALIDKHGSVEEVGQPFVEAERKTGVDCVVVRLSKTASGRFEFDGPYEHEKAVEEAEFNPNALAGKQLIASVVAQYEAARSHLIEMYGHEVKLRYYLKGIGEYNSRDATPKATLQEALLGLKADFWDYIFKRTKIGEVTTSKFKEDFKAFRDQTVSLSFSAHNIGEIIALFVLNRDSIMQNCIVQTFDKATAYHKDNMVHTEGWVTNKSYKVARKIIMPYGVRFDTQFLSTWSVDWRQVDFFEDLDKCLCFVTGKPLDAIVSTGRVVRDRVDALNRNKADYQQPFNSEFFQIRFFKKGTVHLVFTDDFAWTAFNQAAAQGKNWIGKN